MDSDGTYNARRLDRFIELRSDRRYRSREPFRLRCLLPVLIFFGLARCTKTRKLGENGNEREEVRRGKYFLSPSSSAWEHTAWTLLLAEANATYIEGW
jgi:hypothetical protein